MACLEWATFSENNITFLFQLPFNETEILPNMFACIQ